jgi:ureidoglycolate dehydrogenase (NAD+)
LPKYAASQPGGLEIKEPSDLWKDGVWNAIIHPIGRDKSYKSFGILWSLHMLGSRFLGLNSDHSFGTLFILMSPEIWEPAIPKEKIIQGFEEELQLLKQMKIAHVPGEGRMKRYLHAQQSDLEVDQDIINILFGEEGVRN